MREINLPEHWKVARLGELGDLVRGVTYKRQETTDTSNPGYLPILRATNIQDRQLLLEEELVYVKDEKISDSQLLRRGDVVIAMSSGSKSVVGKAAQLNIDWEGSFGAFCAVFRPNSTIEPFFIGQVFQTERYREHLLKEARGTNINNLSKGHILDYQFLLPPLPEQRAIAHTLQTIQEAKFTRQREIALERERKAALIDYLFSHGTKGEPRKQTEIGEIPESWEVVKLGDKAELKNGINFKKEQKGQGILTVDVLNMYSDGIYLSTDNLYRVDRKIKDRDLLKANDILFVRSSLKQEGVAWTSLFGEHSEPVTFCGFLIRARLTTPEIDSEFLTNYFRTPFARKFLVSKSARLAITNVSQAILNNCPIALPAFYEQRKIAEILHAFDTKIASLEREVKLIDELFHAMLEELMTGQRSAVPLIDAEMHV